MVYDFSKRELKPKMTWDELKHELNLARKDPKFRKAIREFIKLTTS
ncbi:hypothetical protein HY489_00950 [Candidatus Woesearchaeota archaeon]|nr:hypothetical protein [Candidatus Woesearchaeota archaeon]